MSRPALHISPSAVLMGYKLPIPLKILMFFAVPVALLFANESIFHPEHFEGGFSFFSLENLGIWIILVGGPLFIYTNNSGYRIAWDDERVYMRDWGFRNVLFQRKPFKPIAYDDIVSMEGRFGKNTAAKSRFMPYEYLEIASRRPGEEDIWIYPLSLNQQDLADFLIHLHGRRPDIFPDVVLELMRKDGLVGAM